MRAYAYDESQPESMRVVEFETMTRAKEWVKFMNDNDNGNYVVLRRDPTL